MRKKRSEGCNEKAASVGGLFYFKTNMQFLLSYQRSVPARWYASGYAAYILDAEARASRSHHDNDRLES